MPRNLLLIPFFLSLFLCSQNLTADSSIPGYPEAGHWPYGPVTTIETYSGARDLLLYGEGTVLQIADADNPEDLQPLAEVETGFMVNFIDILDNGQMAAVADRDKWISLIDIADPASPSLLGRYEVEDGRIPYGVAFGPADSNKLYAAVGPAGLWVIDISNPSNPTLDGAYIQPGTDFVFDVEVLGDFAFLADDLEGVTAIDVSDPENPVLSAEFAASSKEPPTSPSRAREPMSLAVARVSISSTLMFPGLIRGDDRGRRGADQPRSQRLRRLLSCGSRG